MNNHITKQTIGKRILAGLLDFIFVVALAFFMYIPVELVADLAKASTYETEFVLTLHYSELYEINFDTNTIDVAVEEKYPEALYGFYVDKYDDVNEKFQRGFSPILVTGSDYNTAEHYYTVVLGKGSVDTLFDFAQPIDAEAPWQIPVKTGKTAEAEHFFTTEFVKALLLLEGNSRLIELVKKMYLVTFIKYISAFLTSALVMTVLFPLFFKDKVTIGKLITKSKYTTKYGYEAGKKQLLFRNVSVFVFSYIFFFMPFHVVSLLMAAFKENGASFFDVLSGTFVVDKKESLVFKNIEDERRYSKELNRRIAQHRTRSKGQQ